MALFKCKMCGGSLEIRISLMNSKKYDEAISAFEALKGYQDSKTMISECKYIQASLFMSSEDTDDAYSIFNELGGYT